MMRTTAIDAPRSSEAFRHEALLYAGQGDFLEGTLSFIRDGISAQEPILAVLNSPKIEMLRSELGGDADSVRFADMALVGHNPARIIPAWREFVTEHGAGGRRFRGIGEPIWPARSPEELVECERHEALLNFAFAGAPTWWLLCPYDTESLESSVIEEAHRNHPFVLSGGLAAESALYRGLAAVEEAFDHPLPEPPGRPEEMTFRSADLDAVRTFVSGLAAATGFDTGRTGDLILAVNELATNSLRHGGGRGVLRMWQVEGAMICEVRDEGRIGDPLVGRRHPSPDGEGGFGLWLVNHLCDLVQVRSFPTGSVVRVHMSPS